MPQLTMIYLKQMIFIIMKEKIRQNNNKKARNYIKHSNIEMNSLKATRMITSTEITVHLIFIIKNSRHLIQM